MGDRGNIAVLDRRRIDGKDIVGYTFLYTHWGGSGIAVDLQTALRKRWRWDDDSYLARIIFDVMTDGRHGEETSFGISPFIGDNEHIVLVVDTEKQQVTAHQEEMVSEPALEQIEPGAEVRSWTFEEFCAIPDGKIETLMDGLYNVAKGLPEEGE